MKADLLCALENETLETLTVDLSKTHSLPKITTGVTYYKKTIEFINVYNFVHCVNPP